MRILLLAICLLPIYLLAQTTWQQDYETAAILLDKGNFKEAFEAGIKVIDNTASNSKEQLLFLFQLASIQQERCLFSAADSLVEQYLQYEQADVAIAKGLSLKAHIYTHLERFDEAETLFIRAIKLAKQHPQVLTDIHEKYGYLSYKKSNYQKADSLLRIAIKDLNELSREKGVILLHQGIVKWRLGELQVADSLLFMAKNILSTQIKTPHPIMSVLWEHIGLLKFEQSEYSKATKAFEECKAIWNQRPDKNHLDYASFLNHQAILLNKQGKEELAEENLETAKNINRHLIGDRSIPFADNHVNLAETNRMLGDFERAEELLKIAEYIYSEKKHYLEHANCLNNLGLIYDELAEDSVLFQVAEDYYLRAIALLKKYKGSNNLQYGIFINNLAGLYDYWEKYDQAKPLYEEALQVIKNVLGTQNNYYTTILSNRGILYEQIEQPEKAGPLYHEAEEIRRKILGTKHPKYIELIYNLAAWYIAIDPHIALDWYKKANKGQIDLIQYYYSTIPESTRLDYLQQVEIEFERFYSLANIENVPSEVIIELQKLLLKIKGLVLEYSANQRLAIKQSDDPVLKNTMEIWLKKREALGEEFNSELLVEVENLEKELLRATNSTDIKRKLVDYKAIKTSLQSKEAAIDFVRFTLFRNYQWEEPIYYALITRPEYEYPKIVQLGEENSFVDVIAGTFNEGPLYLKYQQLGEQLVQQIWQPIAPYLEGVKKIHIAPDGLLNRISFESLPWENTLLANKYQFRYYNNLRDFVVKKDNPARIKNKSIALAGGALYDSTATYLTDTARTRSAARFNYLLGTKEEVLTISDQFLEKGWDVAKLIGTNASEENIKQLNGEHSPSILHLSTHGYFFGKDYEEAEENDSTLRYKMIHDPNPLNRSGLVFSGVNKYWENTVKEYEGENGVFTAYEISNMELSNTKLVVLSACETGLGDIFNGEGVFGLQRAFKTAGVDQLIISLWKVPDQQTSELMQLFYKYFLKGNTPQKALYKAKKKVRKKYKDPFFWAGFILIQ